MRDPNELVWMDVVDNNFWWAADIAAFRLDENDELAFSADGYYAMTDTGTSCTYVPDAIFINFRQLILDQVDSSLYYFDADEYYVYTDCDSRSQFPVIQYAVGGYWLESRPEDYFVEWAGSCFMCIFSNGFDDMFLLGDDFLRGYYSVHDHTTAKFGFAPNTGSVKNAPI